jgi:SAM-dependent methyltransferase
VRSAVDTPRDNDLHLPRRKPRSLGLSIAWRALQLYGTLLGKERLLRFSLDGHWLLRRVSHELAIEVLGDDYYWHATAFTPLRIAKWIRAGATVLDIGCGDGRISRAVAKVAARVVGIDHDPKRVETAIRSTTEPNVRYLRTDAMSGLSAELLGSTFDVVLLIAVLEHIDDADAVLAGARRLAGEVIVEVPYVATDPLNSVRRRMGCRLYTDVDHVREYTRDMLVEELERNGWRVETIEHEAGNLLARAVAR